MPFDDDPEPQPWWWLTASERRTLGLGDRVERTADGFLFGDEGAACRVEIVARDENAPVKLGSASLRVWGALDDPRVKRIVVEAARTLHARRGRGFEPTSVSLPSSGSRGGDVVIDVPSVCDRACVFCHRSSEPVSARRTNGRDDDVLARIDAANGDILFSGDDAMSHRRIVEFVARAHARGVGRVAGIGPLRESHARSNARALAKAGLSSWSTGLFGGDAVSHDRVAGLAGAFDTLMLATAVMRDAGIAVRFVTPLVRPVLASLADIVACARTLSGESTSLLAYAPDTEVGVAFDSVVPDYAELRAALERLGNEGPGADALPLCVLPERRRANASARLERTDGRIEAMYPGAICGDCDAKSRCPGVPSTVLRANRGEGLVALRLR